MMTNCIEWFGSINWNEKAMQKIMWGIHFFNVHNAAQTGVTRKMIQEEIAKALASNEEKHFTEIEK